MKEILKKIIVNSRWTYPIFEGKIIVEGRILSPSESEVCGLATALIAKSVLSEDDLRQLSKIKEEDMEEKEDNIDQIFQILQNFDADKILHLSLSQDKILNKCVYRASSDDGVTWQDFKLVVEESQQSINRNWLWIGLLEEEDRKQMINLCMVGHKKASEAIRGSL